MKGFFNRLLRIDLSKKRTTVEPIPDSILRSYLGGKGLGSYLLL
ncbi:MAG: aldehyde ferredoxin oxidoreductase N-terminal domain-containing protein, partial [Deltaproteobacteria bacterium]|nr:aldehyde ferredoxin oxidoreductase N-terminal domain-containing protein [Deltaproteobacteria bacterium]